MELNAFLIGIDGIGNFVGVQNVKKLLEETTALKKIEMVRNKAYIADD